MGIINFNLFDIKFNYLRIKYILFILFVIFLTKDTNKLLVVYEVITSQMIHY